MRAQRLIHAAQIEQSVSAIGSCRSIAQFLGLLKGHHCFRKAPLDVEKEAFACSLLPHVQVPEL
jgi:hypothetical protein